MTQTTLSFTNLSGGEKPFPRRHYSTGDRNRHGDVANRMRPAAPDGWERSLDPVRGAVGNHDRLLQSSRRPAEGGTPPVKIEQGSEIAVAT